jgi:hypothetical protein
MAEVTYNGPRGQSCNGSSVTYGPPEPPIVDDWVRPTPGEPVRVDGAPQTVIPAPRAPINNDSVAVIYATPADGRKLVPGHVPDAVATFEPVKTTGSPIYVGGDTATIYHRPPGASQTPSAPLGNRDAQILRHESGPPITNGDVTIGGGGKKADREIPAGTDHVAFGAKGPTL